MIRKILKYSFYVMLFLTSISNASRIDDLMNLGNSAYQDGNYEGALKNYEEILHENYISAGLYYNLGNTYYKLDQLGKSILSYERALKIAPSYENAEYNLSLVKARTIDKIKSIHELFIISWWNLLLRILTPTGWSIFVLAFFISLLTIIGIWFFAKSSNAKQLLAFVGMGNLVVLFLVAVILFASVKQETTNNYGILLQSTVTVKVSPNSKSGDAFLIHEGVKFSIEDELDDWTEIKLEDGKIGWLPNSSFEII